MDQVFDLDDAASTKTTDGNMIKIAGFGEYNYGNGFAGAELSYNIVGDTKAKASGTTQTLKAENFLRLLLYGTYDFNEMRTGLLSFTEAMHTDQYITPGTAQSNAYNETAINSGARMTF